MSWETSSGCSIMYFYALHILLSRHAPVNTWLFIVPDIKSALDTQAFFDDRLRPVLWPADLTKVVRLAVNELVYCTLEPSLQLLQLRLLAVIRRPSSCMTRPNFRLLCLSFITEGWFPEACVWAQTLWKVEQAEDFSHFCRVHWRAKETCFCWKISKGILHNMGPWKWCLLFTGSVLLKTVSSASAGSRTQITIFLYLTHFDVVFLLKLNAWDRNCNATFLNQE